MAHVKEKHDSILKIYENRVKANHPGVILGFEDAVEKLDTTTFTEYLPYFWYFEHTEDKAKEMELLEKCEGFYLIPDWRLFTEENDILFKTIPAAMEMGKGILLGMHRGYDWGDEFYPSIGTANGPSYPYKWKDENLEYNHFFGALITNYLMKLKELGKDNAKEAYAEAFIACPVEDGEIESFSATTVPEGKTLAMMAMELAKKVCPDKDYSERPNLVKNPFDFI